MLKSDFHYDLNRYKTDTEEPGIKTFFRALYNHPAIAGIGWYRLSRYGWQHRRNPVFWVVYSLTRILYPLIRIYSGLEMKPTVICGPGLWIGHFGKTVIHPQTVIGENATILHGVTIGSGRGGIPRIGDNVSIGCHAVIIGGITVGNDVIIGAGAVVTHSIPDFNVATGVPAHFEPIKTISTAEISV